MSEKADRSVLLHQDGALHCAQAVLSVYGPGLGLDEGTAIKVASGFGAGLGRTGRICGAVTGAIMVLGMTFDHKDPSGREKVYSLVRKLINEFVERNGSIKCSKLLGCDIGTEEGLNMFRERKLVSTICKKVDRDAAELLEEILSDVRTGT